MTKVVNVETVQGKITLGNQVIQDNVVMQVTHTIDERSDLKGWSGMFTSQSFIQPDSCHLVLSDGREGNIIITRSNFGTNGGHVHFTGSGLIEIAN